MKQESPMRQWDILQHLTESHIEITWGELKDRFGFNLDYWRKEFRNFMSSQPRNVSDVDGFIVFGNRRINSVLNNVLGRNELFPTFNNMMSYIVKKETNSSRNLNNQKI